MGRIAYTGSMPDPGYEELDHTADWCLRVRGRDLSELLVHAAEGMLDLMQAQPRPGESRPTQLEIQADDPVALLVQWLQELLYRMDTAGVTFRRFVVRTQDDTRLTATLEEADLGSLSRAIKAVTYHGLKLAKTPHGLEATLVFDV